MTGRRGVLAVLVLVACAAIVWLARRTPDEQRAPVVTLLSTGATEITVAQGTPIFLEISVTGVRDTTGPVIGSRLKPWHELIALQAISNGQSVPLAVVTSEAPRARELSFSSAGQPDVRGYQPRVAALDGANRVFRVEVAAGPDTMERLAPGRYEIVAVVNSPWWQMFGWRGRKESPPLTLVVSPRVSGSDETRLAATAEYFLKTGQADEALRAARSWIATAPQDVAAHTMAGDVFAASGDQMAARQAYEHALELAKGIDASEPPTAILARLDRLPSIGAR